MLQQTGMNTVLKTGQMFNTGLIKHVDSNTSQDASKFHDAFNQLDDYEKDFVMMCVAQFHIRNGTRQNDGSRGEIDITSKQMNNLLAFVYKRGYQDDPEF